MTQSIALISRQNAPQAFLASLQNHKPLAVLGDLGCHYYLKPRNTAHENTEQFIIRDDGDDTVCQIDFPILTALADEVGENFIHIDLYNSFDVQCDFFDNIPRQVTYLLSSEAMADLKTQITANLRLLGVSSVEDAMGFDETLKTRVDDEKSSDYIALKMDVNLDNVVHSYQESDDFDFDVFVDDASYLGCEIENTCNLLVSKSYKGADVAIHFNTFATTNNGIRLPYYTTSVLHLNIVDLAKVCFA